MADDLVTVFGTLDPLEAARIEALLRAAGIEVLLADSGQAAVVHGAAGFRFPLELRVPAGQAEQAERIAAEALASQPEDALGSWSEADPGAEEEAPGQEPSLERSRDPVLAPLLSLSALHLTLVLLAGGGAGRQRLVELGALQGWPAPSEAYRLVTYAFLHAGLEHLAWNTVSLVLFGWGAIRLFGLARTTFAYALGAVASGAASAWLIPDVVVGASGAIYALVAMVLVADLRLAARSARPRRKLLLLAGLALLLLPGVFSHNILAHLAGVGAGALLGRLYDVASPELKRDRASRLLGWAGAAILLLPWGWALPAVLARLR